MNYFLTALFLLSAVLSCNDDDVDCSNFIPSPQEFYFTISNSNGEILIGDNSIYAPSDIILLNENSENVVFLIPENDTRVGIRYITLQSDIAYSLNVGDDKDILILTFESGECGSKRLIELKYNNTTYQGDSADFYTLVKN